MTVVLVSPFIDPEAVGEPRWCYDLAKAVAARTEVIIVAQSPRNRSFLVADLFPGVEVHEHAPWPTGFLPRRIEAMAKPNFLRFYPRARRDLRHILSRRAIRCAHHFGPLALRFPTPLARLGVPYLFGPLGGSLPAPAGLDVDSGRQPWYTRLRSLDAVRWRHDPMLRGSYEDAACLVGVAPYVSELLSGLRLRRFEAQSEVCAREQEGAREAIAERAGRGAPLRLLTVSRLVPSKGVQFAVEAVAGLDAGLDWRLDVVGDGAMKSDLLARCQELGLWDRVTFHGHVPRARVDDFYRQADIFLFPSVQEPSGSVIFEAMSWGLPIIAANYGGPAWHVKDGFGLRVPVTARNTFTTGLAQAIRSLAISSKRRSDMGEAALDAAGRSCSWQAAADLYTRLYDEIASSGAAVQ